MRERIEAGFGWWAEFVWRRPWWLIVAMLALGIGLGSRVPLLSIETDPETYLQEDDPVTVAYDALRAQFGRDRLVMIAIEPPEVFDLGFLERLRQFHADLEAEVPYLEEITSLVNARSTYGVGDELIVEDLLEDMPRDAAELAALRARVMNTPSYLDRVISADGRVTNILIESDAYTHVGLTDQGMGGFDSDAAAGPGADGEPVERPYLSDHENSEVVDAVMAVVERYRAPDFRIQVAGSVLIPHEISNAMERDMPRFLGLSLLVSAVLLGVSFRRVLPVLMSLVVVLLAVASTLGAAQLAGFHVDIAAQIMPSFLLSVGVGYSVHLLAGCLQALDAGQTRREALESALRHSGLPILMTGITTVAGLLSFLAAVLTPIASFGLVAATGVCMTLLYGLVLLPALIAVIPLSGRPRASTEPGAVDRLLGACARLAARHPWPVVAASLAAMLVGVAVGVHVRFSNDPIAYLPEDNEFRVATDYIDARLGGTLTLEVVIDTGRENGLHEPEVLNKIEALGERVAELEAEGETLRRTSSLLDVLKETHRALNGNRDAFYAVPQARLLVAQELLLFENSGSDDLEKLVDPQFSMARFIVRTTWEDGFDKIAIVERVNREFREIMGDSAELVVTGMAVVITRSMGATIESLVRSYALALALITPLMMLLIGSLRSGLVSMVPNLLPIALTLALMVVCDFSLDMFTLMVGCIAIGLAVDDTIHLIAGFRRFLARTGDPLEAMELTMQSTGRAIFFTSSVLALGFLVFVFSSMANLRAFGLLTAFAISAAFVLDVVATPAFLILVTRRRGSA